MGLIDFKTQAGIKDIRPYDIRTGQGRQVRVATLVELTGGRIIRFDDKMTQHMAISQTARFLVWELIRELRAAARLWNPEAADYLITEASLLTLAGVHHGAWQCSGKLHHSVCGPVCLHAQRIKANYFPSD